MRVAEDGGWGIVVLDLGVDMTTPNGRLVAHLLMAVAEWEREMIGQRIREGLAQSDKTLGRVRPTNGGGTPAAVPGTDLLVGLIDAGEQSAPALTALPHLYRAVYPGAPVDVGVEDAPDHRAVDQDVRPCALCAATRDLPAARRRPRIAPGS